MRITGDGTVGPNQEFALIAALDLPEGTVLGAGDTDGIDGPIDAAGAVVTAETVQDRDAASAALAANDEYTYLDKQETLVFPAAAARTSTTSAYFSSRSSDAQRLSAGKNSGV